MYSFQPIADTTGSHVGFYVVAMLVAAILFGVWRSALANDLSIGASLTTSVVLTALASMVYVGSYHDVAPNNEQVTGTFVTFQPEGYNVQSGKSRSDHHYMYVVYNVNGQNIILQASTGYNYPQTATLYKN